MEATHLQCNYCGQAVALDAGSCLHCGNVTSEEIFEKRESELARGERERHSRPKIITVICVLKCIGAIVSSLVIFSDEMRSLGSGFTAFLAIELIITFVWIAGVWKMRKWGVLTYLMLTAAVQGVSSKMGVWSPGDFVKSAILLSILFWHFPRMK